MNEHIDIRYTVDCLAESAGRALGSVVTKMIKNGGFPYKVFSTLYDSCVASIVDYGSEVFGFEQYHSKVTLHLRAIRAFLGLPKNSCHAAVLSEVDWLEPHYRSRLNMVRFFNRVLKMDDNRLTKIVLKWDKDLNDSGEISTWGTELKTVFIECNMEHLYEQFNPFPSKATIKLLESSMKNHQIEKLRSDCLEKPKLRTFVQIKDFHNTPSYILKPLSFLQRKLMAKLRVGSLPLRLETGRFCKPYLPENLRTCQVCVDKNVIGRSIENELHFLFDCSAYERLRAEWLSKLKLPNNFESIPTPEKMSLVLNQPENVKPTSRYIADAYSMRSRLLCN